MKANIIPRDMQVNEVLDEVSALKSDELKVELLKMKYSDHVPLQRVLKMNFCDSIISVLPEGVPPFNREKQDGPNLSSLWAYAKNFAYFVKSAQSANMKPLQIEKIFIEMLEAIDVEEADMICLAKDKKLQEKWNISVDVVKRAFPSLNIRSNAPSRPKTQEELAEEKKEKIAMLKARAKELSDKSKALLAEAKALETA